MMKLTDAGKLICQSIAKQPTAGGKYHIPLRLDGNDVTVTVGETNVKYIPLTGVYVAYYATFGFFGGYYTSFSAYYGDEFSYKTDTKASTNSGDIALLNLPNSVTVVVNKDETTKCNYLTGVVTNETDRDLTIKYVGLAPTFPLTSNTTVPSGTLTTVSVNLGILSYIEIDKPITLAPGEDLAFKISID